MNTIISTKPYSCCYEKYERNDATHFMRTIWSVRINGGAGVIQGKGHLYTPNGVTTEIDDEGLAILETIPQFQNDVKRGFIKVIKGTASRMVDVDEVAADMSDNHMARPLTEKDFKDSGAAIDPDDGSIDVTGDKDSKESVAKKAIRRRHNKRG